MPKIKLVDEQIDAIMVKELKTAHKMTNRAYYAMSEDEVEIVEAIETMLRYYMVLEEAESWIMKQRSKVQ